MQLPNIILLAASITIYFSGECNAEIESDIWVPQLGTSKYPKHPKLSPHVRNGDIYEFGSGNLYLAKMSFTIDQCVEKCLNDTTMWYKIKFGDIYQPKVKWQNNIKMRGEIFVERFSDKDIYYKSNCNVIEASHHDYDACLEQFNLETEWMTLAGPAIEDKRLGDLAIPGSHDSGTKGINDESFLIDRSFLFSLGDLVVPDVLVNWSMNQDTDLKSQLEQGYREVDLRIADCQSLNDTFRWWHGLSADFIDKDLIDIATFAQDHPSEIIIILFQAFVRPSTVPGSGTRPMLPNRKVELNDILLSYLSDQLVPYVNISSNPTVSEVLATGRNIIALMQEQDILEMSELYWPTDVLHAAFSSVSNPEELFNDRSNKLADYLVNHADTMTDISGCFTPDEKTVTAAMLRVYGEIIEEIVPIFGNIDPDEMSYEGLFLDLLSSARYGINEYGMQIRPQDLYSNGASVHFRGVPEMYRHWLARPRRYKPNILYVDDGSGRADSDVITSAILANLGEIPPEVAISFHGNTMNGFYYFENFTAIGGDEGLDCNGVDIQFIIASEQYSISEVVLFCEDGCEFVMQEGEYPPDATVTIQVTSEGNTEWTDLSTFVISDLLQTHSDMHVRGDDLGNGSGFAYIGTEYDIYPEKCGLLPSCDDCINIVEW